MEIPKPVQFKNIYEYIIFLLVAANVFLFFAFNDLNKFIRKDLSEQKREVIIVAHDATSAINNFLLTTKLK